MAPEIQEGNNYNYKVLIALINNYFMPQFTLIYLYN
jgi:hypothetical protein